MTLPTAKSRPNIRLSDQASEPITAVADSVFEHLKRTRLTLTATADHAGKNGGVQNRRHRARADDAQIDPCHRNPSGSRGAYPACTGRLENHTGPSPSVLDGAAVATLGSQNPDGARSAALDEARLAADSAVFTSSCFPVIDFISPVAAEDAIGNYKLHTTFYDSDFKVVTQADRLGRYGAIVEVVPEFSRSFKRYLPLYRGPDNLNFRVLPFKAALQLSPKFEIDGAVARPAGVRDRGFHRR